MKSNRDEPLDKLLRQWAENRAATDEDIAALHGRVSSAFEKAAPADLSSSQRPPRDLTVVKHAAWFCMGAAAAAIEAIEDVWQLVRRDARARVTNTQSYAGVDDVGGYRDGPARVSESVVYQDKQDLL